MTFGGLGLEHWGIAKEFLSKSVGMSHGAFNLDDIHKLIQQRDAQLWAVYDNGIKAVMVTEIVNYPNQKRLRMFLLGGTEMSSWEQLVSDTFDEYALAHGCDGVELRGRRGWAKNLKQFGYDEYETTMVKILKRKEHV